MNNINEKQPKRDSDLKTLELKANLNPEQREYLEVLKDKMKKVLGNKTKQELANAGDLASLKNYRAVLIEILDFLKSKEVKGLVEYRQYKILPDQFKVLYQIEEVLKAKYKMDTIEARTEIIENPLSLDVQFEVDIFGNITALSLAGFSFENIPDLSDLKKLKKLDCRLNLNSEIPGLENLQELELLACNDHVLLKIPDLHNLQKLKQIRYFANIPIRTVTQRIIRRRLPPEIVIDYTQI